MNDPTLVVLFLRGGADGLSLVAPTRDKHYIAARPARLRVASQGKRSTLALDNPLADVGFCFHPSATELAKLYQQGDLAVVHAAGLIDPTRSHFDAEDRMERALPGQGATAGGWLARWLDLVRPGGILPALALGGSLPESLRGEAVVAVAPELSGLRLAAGHGYASQIRAALTSGLGTNNPLTAPLERLLDLSREVEERVGMDADGQLLPYQPTVDYPRDNPLTPALQSVAQALKLDLGLRVATVDLGGWDTHANQAQDLPPLIEQLSSAVAAFWQDLGERRNSICLVALSEFGRRLRANESGGTDHGHGNLMLVLGAKLKGGRMFGEWPGLENQALDDGADLAITTDYRTVLSEVLKQHMGTPDLSKVFPGHASTPRGLFG